MRERYVLGCEGKIIGPVDIGGHEGALQATNRMGSGDLVRIPNLRLTGSDRQAIAWLDAWGMGTERRDLIIRDNAQGRWLSVTEAWISSPGHTVVTEGVFHVERPDWWHDA